MQEKEASLKSVPKENDKSGEPTCIYTKKKALLRSTFCDIGTKGVPLPLTCDTWIKSSSKRTQILYRADVSSILYYMCIQKGDIILEAGTGTLSLTYALSKAVGETGHIHTVEYNRERYAAALQDISYANLHNTTPYNSKVEKFIESSSILPNKIVLDIPNPDSILPDALRILAPGGRICCFVPCIEQIQRVLACFCTLLGAPKKNIMPYRPSGITVERLLEVVELQHKPVSLSPSLYGTAALEKTRAHTGYLLFLSKKS